MAIAELWQQNGTFALYPDDVGMYAFLDQIFSLKIAFVFCQYCLQPTNPWCKLCDN
jgi:hypothetical protein